ncbi:NUDIX domain-containing protein [bacterium]|nr:NUDIX domain-containing protein [bacterium]
MKIPRCLGHETIVKEYSKVAFRETFEEPDGNLTTFLLFGATKIPVVVFALTDGHVIALKQYRYGANFIGFELPGGVVEHDKSKEETVMDELQQETGFIADLSKIASLHQHGIWFEPAALRTRFFPYFVRDCKRDVTIHANSEVGEHVQLELIQIEEWYSMLREGEIRDAKTYCISLLAIQNLLDDEKKSALKGLKLWP